MEHRGEPVPMLVNEALAELTVEGWTRDCLDVELPGAQGFLEGSWVTIGAKLRWPPIARLRIARYLIVLDIRGRSDPQLIRVSWTGCISAASGHGCIARTARSVWRNFMPGLAGYFCRACIGNPPYATQLLSAQAGLISRLASCVFFSTARRSFRVRFRSVRAICIDGLTTGSDEKE